MAAAFSLLAMPPSPGRIPFLGGDVLVAALMGRPLERGVDVMRPIKRLLDVLFADGRGVPTARTLDERLQVGAPGFVEWNSYVFRLLALDGLRPRAVSLVVLDPLSRERERMRLGDLVVGAHAAPPRWRRTGGAVFATGRDTLMMPMCALSALCHRKSLESHGLVTTTRVHHSGWLRSGVVAARGARAGDRTHPSYWVPRPRS